jgi:hypothetical protein
MPKPEMRQVFSTHVKSIGYDIATQMLYVEYQSGKNKLRTRTAVYKGVPQVTADSVMNSLSVGGAINDQIKGKYEFNYAAPT